MPLPNRWWNTSIPISLARGGVCYYFRNDNAKEEVEKAAEDEVAKMSRLKKKVAGVQCNIAAQFYPITPEMKSPPSPPSRSSCRNDP
jgi:hypothetical protein